MMETFLDFSALEALSRSLKTLSKAENNRVLRAATTAGAALLQREVIALAPERTGKLKRNILVRTLKSRRGDIGSGVYVSGSSPYGAHSDTSMKADDPRNAFYWRFLELGTSTLPAHSFIRPAFDAHQGSATAVVMEHLLQAVDKALAQ